VDTPRDRQCEQVRNSLSDFLIGHMSKHTKSAVQRHLDVCEACRNELAALQRTGELLSMISLPEAPDLWPAISAKLETRVPSLPRRLSWWFVRHQVQSAVAVVLILIISTMFLMTGNQSLHEPRPETYLTTHASMSWRQPFADRAALGLATTLPAEIDREESR